MGYSTVGGELTGRYGRKVLQELCVNVKTVLLLEKSIFDCKS